MSPESKKWTSVRYGVNISIDKIISQGLGEIETQVDELLNSRNNELDQNFDRNLQNLKKKVRVRIDKMRSIKS